MIPPRSSSWINVAVFLTAVWWWTTPETAVRAQVTYRRPALDSLRTALDEIFAQRLFRQSRVGFLVRSMTTGETLYEKDADTLLSTASCLKLVTTAAALDRWGPAHRFKTAFLTDAEVDSGAVKGDVFVKGYGDPYFVTEVLLRTAYHLHASGIREIRGRLVVDDSYLQDTPNAIRNDRAYAAIGGAVSYNFNSVTIYFQPGKKIGDLANVFVEPPLDIFTVVNTVKTVDSASGSFVDHNTVSASYGGDRITIRVAGTVAIHEDEIFLYKRVDDPALFSGLAIRDAFHRAGIRTTGEVAKGRVPAGARRMYETSSYDLSYIVSAVNKWSNNFIAGQLLMILGAETYREPGTDEKGIRAVAPFLERVGIRPSEIVMVDGSGLDDRNKMSPRAQVRLLEYMYRHPEVGPEFVASLSIAGVDGSERKRFRKNGGPARRSRLKVGYLWSVSGLSGYIATRGGDVLAFSILSNDFPKDYYESIKQLEDRICSVLEAL
jgi:D-alanyl-D-alanine carboxypeptidase/D-alanyl-D-alanine-endopeptidase (penicillin-binding protein 4)